MYLTKTKENMNIYLGLSLLVCLTKVVNGMKSWDGASKGCMAEAGHPSILLPKFLLSTPDYRSKVLNELANGTSAWIDGEVFNLRDRGYVTLKMLKLTLPQQASFSYIEDNGVFVDSNVTYDEVIDQNITLASVNDVVNGRLTTKKGIYWINSSKDFVNISRQCVAVTNVNGQLQIHEYLCDMMMKGVCITISESTRFQISCRVDSVPYRNKIYIQNSIDLPEMYHKRTLLQVIKHRTNSSSDDEIILLDKESSGRDKTAYSFQTKAETNNSKINAITSPLDKSLSAELDLETIKNYALGMLIATSSCFVLVLIVAIIQYFICKRLLFKLNTAFTAKEKQLPVYDEVNKDGMLHVQLRPTSNKNTIFGRDTKSKQEMLPESSLYETAHDKVSDPSISYGNLIPSDPSESTTPETPSNSDSGADTGVKELIENEGVRKSNDYTSFV